MAIKQIFHIADIHIYPANYAHIRYAWKQFIAIILAVPNYRAEAIVAIAGDIFDQKKVDAGDIALFNQMMADLEGNQIRAIMMPGNHDYNINQDERNAGDLILSLVATAGYRYVSHYSLSATVIVDNLAFFIHSPIDGKMPRPGPEHAQSKKIAMVHEPFTSARSDSGMRLNGKRFSAADFMSTFDMTLLGDIHVPQKLAANVAYAGSFVQKNRGEGIDHGYNLWDVTTNSCTFIPIPQLSVHLKIVAHANTCPTLPASSVPVVARSVQLHYTSCSDEWVKSYSGILHATYNRQLDGAYNRSSITHEESKSAQPAAPTSSELDRMIAAQLAVPEVSTERRARVTAIHRAAFDKLLTSRAPPSNWRLRHLYWSNLYCYGEDNHLNFDELPNLSSILGRNEAGKSSVPDILVFVLFNETVRGGKTGVLRWGETRGHVKCIFSIGNDMYSVERAWLNAHTNLVRLYKNDVNISGEDMSKTYKLIEDLIGSKRIFINSTVALQERQPLVNISAKERYELVCRMIDLDRLREVEDENKSELRVAKKVSAANLGASASDELKAQLEKKTTELTVLKTAQQRVQAELSRLSARRLIVVPDANSNTETTCADISRRLEQLERFSSFNEQSKLDQLIARMSQATNEQIRTNRESAFITSKIDIARAALLPEPKTELSFDSIAQRIAAATNIDFASLASKYAQKSSMRESIAAELNTARIELDRYAAEIPALQAKLETPTRNIDAIEAELAEVEKKEFVVDRVALDELQSLRSSIDAKYTQLTALQLKSADYKSAQLDALARSSALVWMRESLSIEDISAKIAEKRTSIARLNGSADAIARLNETELVSSILRWSDGCDDCKYNRATLADPTAISSSINEKIAQINAQRAQEEESLTILCALARRSYETMIAEVAGAIKVDMESAGKITKRRDDAERARARQSALANELNAVKEQQRSLASLSEKNDAVMRLNPLVNEKMQILSALTREVAEMKSQIESYQSIGQLRADYEVMSKNRETRADIACLESELAELREQEDAQKTEISQLTIDIGRLEMCRAKSNEYAQLVAQFELVSVSEGARDELANINESIAKYEKMLKSAQDDIARVTHEVGMISGKMGAAIQSMEKKAADDEHLADLELYDKIINHKTGIPRDMMRNACARIEAKCNEVFEQIEEGFKISITFDEEVTINQVMGNAIINAEQASGYRKFVIDIVMRQAFCALTTSGNPRILFIDEGFGTSDPISFDIICRKVLPVLARNFDKVIVMSHIPGIHEFTEGSCTVEKTDGKSMMRFGSIDKELAKMRVVEEQFAAAKSSIAERAARKEEKKTREAAEKEQKKREDAGALQEQSASIGDSIISRVDDRKVKCDACGKEYNNVHGFAQKHLETIGHVKAMTIYLKKLNAARAETVPIPATTKPNSTRKIKTKA